MSVTNQQIILVSRPIGYPTEANFELIEVPIPKPATGEILIRTLYLSVDPYMRGRMNANLKSYASPVGDREVMTGRVVGQVIESKNTGSTKLETLYGAKSGGNLWNHSR